MYYLYKNEKVKILLIFIILELLFPKTFSPTAGSAGSQGSNGWAAGVTA